MSRDEVQRPTGVEISRLAAEVSVIATRGPDGPAGIAASTGVSLSLRPLRFLAWLLSHWPLAAPVQRVSATRGDRARLRIIETS